MLGPELMTRACAQRVPHFDMIRQKFLRLWEYEITKTELLPYMGQTRERSLVNLRQYFHNEQPGF